MNSIVVKPVLGDYLLLEDREGNLSLGVYTGNFTLLEGSPPMAEIIKWEKYYTLPSWDYVITESGRKIIYFDVFFDDKEISFNEG